MGRREPPLLCQLWVEHPSLVACPLLVVRATAVAEVRVEGRSPPKSVRTYFPFPDGQPEGWPEEYVALADYDRLRGALAVVLDEIHGGDLQYAAVLERGAE